MRWCGLLLVALACGGCAPDELFVELPPLGSDVLTWVLARVDENDEITVDAGRFPEDALRFAIPQRAVELEVRGYRESLAELGLVGGPVPAAPAGSRGVALPDPASRFAAALAGDGSATAWDRGAHVDGVDGFRRAARDPCARFDAEVGTLPTPARVLWAATLGPDRLLLGGENPYAILMSGTEAPQRLPLRDAAGSITPHPRSAFVDAAGRIWLGDLDGGLWEAFVETDHVRTERRVPATPHGPASALAGDPTTPETQLFTLTTSGALARYQLDHWAPIETVPTEPMQDPITSLVWLAHDELVAGTSGWPTIRHRLPSGMVVEDDVTEGSFGITALSRVGPRELLAAMSGGLIARYRDEQWTQLGKGDFALDIKVFAPRDDGFLFSGVFGYLGQWIDGVGFCPLGQMPVASATVKFMVPFRGGLLLVGDAPRGPGDTAYTLVTPATL